LIHSACSKIVPIILKNPILAKLGNTTIEKLKEVEKQGKLANDLNGYKKKNKLEIGTVTMEDVNSWIS
jgi:hypothetical protein